MKQTTRIEFVDNPAIVGRLDKYKTVTVGIDKILKSWRQSLYAFEYLTKDGQVKAIDSLPEEERRRVREVAERMKNNAPFERPVMGIGILENVEIGIGRATFLYLAGEGYDTIPVHIPKSNEEEFDEFLQS